MRNLLFIFLVICSIQQEKRIILRFMDENKELVPVYAYWNDYYKTPSKQENISLMRTIQGVTPQIVVTKRYVQLHIIQGEEVATMTFEPSGSGVIDIVIPTGKNDSKSKNGNKSKDIKSTSKKILQ